MALVALWAMTGCYEDNETEPDAFVGGGGGDAAVTPCTEGEVQPCFVEGQCRGEQTCSGGTFGTCTAPPEVCDGRDNDCDGTADEGYAQLGEPCEAGSGACLDRGRYVCTADGADVVCDATPGDGTTDVCDGIDNDCDGTTDEEAAAGGACDTRRLGVCAAGTAACVDGDTVCTPDNEPTTEVCDGLDNDCDGHVDEGDAGGPLAEPCYDGPEGTAGVGVCTEGVRVCTDGAFGACTEQRQPGNEICDGLDNDCDGTVDSDDCGCIFGDTRDCYTGAEGTMGVGACVGGSQTCLEDGTFGPCVGEVVPGVEACDGVDNDCDGEIDDAPGAGQPCSVGVGACAADGTRVCDLESGQVVCDAEAGLPADEVCDGQDNDCDGIVDDVDGAGELCEIGQGACLDRGVLRCDGGALACDAVEGAPGVESCNEIDDDCDGTVDEVDGLGEACEIGVGRCRSTATTICDYETGGVTCPATAQAPAPFEFCDNFADDDCDGQIDEDDCQDCPDGACLPDNELDCTNGVDDDGDGAADCDDDDCALAPACLVETICDDGLDDDGDGAIDCDDIDCLLDPACDILPGEFDCTNGLDDDLDGDVDCADADCADDPICGGANGTCEAPLIIDGPGVYEGDTSTAESNHIETEEDCVTFGINGAGSAEDVYAFTPAADGTFCLSTGGTEHDTVLYVREATCDDPAAEIACNDDSDVAGGVQSALDLVATAGTTYYVFVDGWNLTNDGPYTLTVSQGSCDEEPPVEICDNGADDDGDGDVDCDDADCARDPACFECGVNDVEPNEDIETATPIEPGQYDGLGICQVDDIDYYAIELCGGGTLIVDVLFIDADGDVEAFLYAADGAQLDSSTSSTDDESVGYVNGGGDRTVYLAVDGFQAAVNTYALDITIDDCGGAFEICDDGEDGDGDGDIDCEDDDCRDDPACGDIARTCDDPRAIGFETLTVQLEGDGQIDDASCLGAPDGAAGPEGVFVFTADAIGTVCVDTLGSMVDTILTVRGEPCDDPASEIACDDDGGMAGTSQLEVDVVAGESYFIVVDTFGGDAGEAMVTVTDGACAPIGPDEICDNGEDDDDDGLVDCADRACVDDPACNDPLLCLGATPVQFGVQEGALDGESGTSRASCAFPRDSAAGPEVVYAFTALEAGTVCADTVGSQVDTILTARNDACTGLGSELGCNDDTDGFTSALELEVDAAVTYYFVVDTYAGERGDYTFRLRPGPCDQPFPVEMCANGADDDFDDDTDCDDADCADAVACADPADLCGFDFEGDALDAAFSTEGDAPWTVADGVATSGDIGASQRSTLRLGVSTPAGGAVSFRYRVSSENLGFAGQLYDYLEFRIDGVAVLQEAGEVPFTDAEFALLPGEHVLEWVYSKDNSVNRGEDLAQIDDLFVSGTGGVCDGVVAERCDNGADDDGDGAADCDDDDCALDPACLSEIECADGLDDDGDGDIDCDDADCVLDPACIETICDDGLDDDGDGDIDCDDDDCALLPECQVAEIACDDGLDNDLDGDTDCADPDCADDAACQGEEGALRLVDGADERSGRLEVFHAGQWGTVCDDNWEAGFPSTINAQGYINADVACRQLGFPGAASTYDAQGGVDPIWLDQVACVGDEASLVDCPANDFGDEDCGHGEDIGLICLADGACRVDAHCAAGEICVAGACLVGAREICDDGIDNDNDGDLDCDDADCDGAVGCGPDFGDATAIAAQGGTIVLEGSIDAEDPTYARPNANCSARVGSTRYEAYRVVNDSGSPQRLTITAAWGDDGYLHVFRDPFTPLASPVGCVVGNDDLNGDEGASRVSNVAIAPGEVLVIVASTFDNNAAIGAFSIEVLTQPELCDDGVDNDGDGDVDCDDADCDGDPICDAPLPPFEVSIQGFDMNPDPVVIPVGGTVRWTNRDAATHTVTSGAPGAPDAGAIFDSGNLGQGATFEHTFDAPGAFEYFCRPHQGSMFGYVVLVGDAP